METNTMGDNEPFFSPHQWVLCATEMNGKKTRFEVWMKTWCFLNGIIGFAAGLKIF